VYTRLVMETADTMPFYIFVAKFLLFAAVHSVMATEFAKYKLRVLGRRYRLAYNSISIVLCGWLMLSWPFSKVLYFLPGVWSIVFSVLQLLLLLAIIRTLVSTGLSDFLGISGSTINADDKLITNGPYRYVRHPLYSISTIFMLLSPVMTVKWFTFTLLSVLYFIIGAHIEEKRLLDKFGKLYAKYSEEVPMFIPRLFKSGIN